MANISVIIPCYNVEKVVGRCLTSIENQTLSLENFEIICVNDGSNDNTLEILQEWEKKYPDNIIIVNCEENRKPGNSRNIGLDYATSKWIAFIDSDDWIEKEYFEKMLFWAESKNCDIVSCQFIRDTSAKLTYLPSDDTDITKNNTLFHIDSINARKEFFHAQSLRLYAWAKIIKRDFLIANSIYFPEDLAYEDIFWGNLIHLYANTVYITNQKLYHYYVNPDSIVMKKNQPYHLDHLVVQEMMWNDWITRGFLSDYRDILEYEYFYTGYLAFLKILAYRYDEPQYSLFQLLQTLTYSKLSYADNPYISREVLPEFHANLLELSRTKLTISEYQELINLIRKIGL